MESIITFLFTPFSGSAEHIINSNHALHGRLMVVAWCILFPLGVLVARFYKITRKQKWPEKVDNQSWWATHLLLQITGIITVLVAVYLAYQPGFESERVPFVHELMGWAIVLLCLSQTIGGLLRGTKGEPPVLPPSQTNDAHAFEAYAGDHYNMTPKRIVFEYCHKIVGYLCLLLSIANIFSGLYITDTYRWIWLAIGLWWIFLIFVFVLLQKRGLCIDTYQAIYGPNTALPGNRLRPIGWGIKRYAANEWPPSKNS